MSNGIQRSKRQPDTVVYASEISEENFADVAEKVMDSYSGSDIRNTITSSQLRPILTMINQIAERSMRKPGGLDSEDLGSIQYLKTRIAYAAGREFKVKKFIEKADLFSYIDLIIKNKKKKDVQVLAKYFESLVAFHKYAGGD